MSITGTSFKLAVQETMAHRSHRHSGIFAALPVEVKPDKMEKTLKDSRPGGARLDVGSVAVLSLPYGRARPCGHWNIYPHVVFAKGVAGRVPA
jgi:hypothetical protein